MTADQNEYVAMSDEERVRIIEAFTEARKADDFGTDDWYTRLLYEVVGGTHSGSTAGGNDDR